MGDVNVNFGFELLQSLYDNQIVKKEDVLILFVHWSLIKNSFRCLGIGDSKAYEATEKGTELLPEGWNTHPSYTLRYIKDGKLYILHGIRSDEDLLLNMLKTDSQTVSTVQFPINQTVTNLHGTLENVLPSHQTITQVIQADLVNPVSPTGTTEISTQTSSENSERVVPLRVPISSPPPSIPATRHPLLVNVGGADLNPLAQGGGGMLFDPYRNPRVDPRGQDHFGIPERLPPGAVPPFARFDPFGPPDLDMPRRRPGPGGPGGLPGFGHGLDGYL